MIPFGHKMKHLTAALKGQSAEDARFDGAVWGNVKEAGMGDKKKRLLSEASVRRCYLRRGQLFILCCLSEFLSKNKEGR